jgi:hypothetical protein
MSKKPKFITPPNRLKMKAGSGGLPQQTIAKAQNFMDNYKIDFRPEAEKLNQNLEAASKAIMKAVNENAPCDKDQLIVPVMQLKANAGQFKYQLISDVADICLQFLESLETYDLEVLDIVRAHQKTIHIIIESDLKGDGGKNGFQLVEELHKACQRYYKKHKI